MLEARVRGVVARKDDAIAALREQLAAALAQLRHTEAVLERQRDELLRASGSGS